MNFDTKANLQDRDCVGTAIHIDNEPMLIERLQAFGLIEFERQGRLAIDAVLRSRPGDVRPQHGYAATNRGGRHSSVEAAHPGAIGYPIEHRTRI